MRSWALLRAADAVPAAAGWRWRQRRRQSRSSCPVLRPLGRQLQPVGAHRGAGRTGQFRLGPGPAQSQSQRHGRDGAQQHQPVRPDQHCRDRHRPATDANGVEELAFDQFMNGEFLGQFDLSQLKIRPNSLVSTVNELSTLNQQRATATYNGPVLAIDQRQSDDRHLSERLELRQSKRRREDQDRRHRHGGTTTLIGNGPVFSGSLPSVSGPAVRQVDPVGVFLSTHRQSGQPAGRRRRLLRPEQLQRHRRVLRNEVARHYLRYRNRIMPPQPSWTWQNCNYWCQSPDPASTPVNRHYFRRIIGRTFQGEYDHPEGQGFTQRVREL